ncbi:MAG: hypothetical protein NVS9B10_19170 [Nevskia sp.]
MTTQEDRFALATHFYVRLRRHMNRVVDAVWMAQNDEYAKEIVRLAREHGHPELEILAERFEAAMKGLPASSPPAAAAGSAATAAGVIEQKVGAHYVGTLR